MDITKSWNEAKKSVDDSLSSIKQDYKNYKHEKDVKEFEKKLSKFADDTSEELAKGTKEFKKELASLEADLKKEKKKKEKREKSDTEEKEKQIAKLKKDYSKFSDDLNDSMAKTKTFLDDIKKKFS